METCPSCNGTGKWLNGDAQCPICNGTGSVTVNPRPDAIAPEVITYKQPPTQRLDR